MKLAYSPCPNDTFAFDAWVHGKIASTHKPEVTLNDIQQLNAWAHQQTYDVIKVSCFTMGKITPKYTMLPCGAAICNVGPKIIAREPFKVADLANKTILVPGLDTTAYLLLRTLCPEPLAIGVCRYNEILEKVQNGEADCGLLIHESRFTFEEKGFVEICDLGELFMRNFDCPVPLGVVVAKKEVYKEAAKMLKASIQYAFDHPDSSFEYIKRTSQEKDKKTIMQHINTYVNSETLQITETGLRSIRTLLQLAVDQKLLPKESLQFYETDYVFHS
jgi:1,4-dihydroxy-6-naphthoate synthase